MYPTLCLTLFMVWNWRDSSYRLTWFTLICYIVTALLWIAAGVTMLVWVSVVVGALILFVALVIYPCFLLAMVWAHNDFSLPKWVQVGT